MNIHSMDKSTAAAQLRELMAEYEKVKAKGLKLDMSRGKPCSEQLSLADPMLNILTPDECFGSADYRNYGILDGIPEAKALFAQLLGVSADNVIVGGNSSLQLMYDAVARCMLYGHAGGKPWKDQGKIKFIAPVPGYDRHFGICESLGIEMINVAMTDDGPDMDEVERIVKSDASVKGMWNVPKYSNPGGAVYSEETVKRLASMECAAEDFLLMWDNAYVVHSLSGNIAEIPEILSECAKAGNPDRVIEFVSTSKMGYPGAGVAALASSVDNVKRIKSVMAFQTIGYDKINQLRCVKFFKNADGIKAHMRKHADILRPKFEAVNEVLARELGDSGAGSWKNVDGGYFISYYTHKNCAKRTVALCREAGVTLTNAGATFPLGIDPEDSNIRIAPSLPPVEELKTAIEVLALCSRIAALEKKCEA